MKEKIVMPEYGSELKYDPIGNDENIKKLIDKAYKEAVDELTEAGYNISFIGAIHLIWEVQKRILKEVYGIDWKTPQEMNPHVFFD